MYCLPKLRETVIKEKLGTESQKIRGKTILIK